MTNEWLRLAEEDFAVADGEGDLGEGGDVVGGEGGAQRKKLATFPVGTGTQTTRKSPLQERQNTQAEACATNGKRPFGG